MNRGVQMDAIRWVSVAMSILMGILIASVMLAGVLVGFTSLVESLGYSLATISPIAILLLLALRKTRKPTS